MSMEKRNVVEDKRTPEHELTRPDEHWDKEAAAAFKPVSKPKEQPAVVVIGEHGGKK
jgi:hypothetical protein